MLLFNKLEGIGWHTYHVLKLLVTQHPEIDFYFIFDRPYHSSFIFGKNVTPIVLWPPARHPFLWYFWYEIQMPNLLKKIKADIFISLDAYTSISAKIPKITAIHDIGFEFYPNHLGFFAEKFMKYFSPKYAQVSDKIITVSDTTKKDLIKNYSINESKIIVSCNAASDVFKPNPEEKNIQFRAQNTSSEKFFLYVGSIHPRKNLLNTLKAFELFKETNGTAHKLVIIGRWAWQFSIEKSYLAKMKHQKDVIHIKHQAHEELQKWYSAAEALLFLSWYEGFGIPLLEAMQSGIPIVCSDIPSMCEVAGKAALYVHPDEIEAICRAMLQITFSEKKEELKKAIPEQLSKYSWQKAKDALLKAIIELQ